MKPNMEKETQKSSRLSLWYFLLDLLGMDNAEHLITWTDQDKLEFRFVNAEKVAFLWGSLNGKDNMNYAKFSRAMRYYYGKGVLEKIPNKRFYYRFVESNTTKFAMSRTCKRNLEDLNQMSCLKEPIENTLLGKRTRADVKDVSATEQKKPKIESTLRSSCNMVQSVSENMALGQSVSDNSMLLSNVNSLNLPIPVSGYMPTPSYNTSNCMESGNYSPGLDNGMISNYSNEHTRLSFDSNDSTYQDEVSMQNSVVYSSNMSRPNFNNAAAAFDDFPEIQCYETVSIKEINASLTPSVYNDNIVQTQNTFQSKEVPTIDYNSNNNSPTLNTTRIEIDDAALGMTDDLAGYFFMSSMSESKIGAHMEELMNNEIEKVMLEHPEWLQRTPYLGGR